MAEIEDQKPISKTKKIYNIVSTMVVALLFVFLVVVVAVMLIQRSGGQETSIFGYRLYDVLTDSMSGTIEPGEVIICKEVDDVNELKVGDIITFLAPNGNYNETHRIIEIVLDDDGSIAYFRTQGDNSPSADNWQLNPDNIKAKYVRKSLFIGGLRGFLSQWYGYVVLIVIPMCLVIALVIGSFIKDKIALEKEEMRAEGVKLENISEEDKKKLLEIALASENQTDADDVVDTFDGYKDENNSSDIDTLYLDE